MMKGMAGERQEEGKEGKEREEGDARGKKRGGEERAGRREVHQQREGKEHCRARKGLERGIRERTATASAATADPAALHCQAPKAAIMRRWFMR